MTRSTRHLLALFVTGLLAALPLAATVAIFWWAASLAMRWLGPESAVGSLLVGIGLGVTGSEIVAYLLGVALVAGLIVLLGAFVRRLAFDLRDVDLRLVRLAGACAVEGEDRQEGEADDGADVLVHHA